ncbi:hypothetical protein PFV2_gp02 [Pyrobaculum filamentous virus 2]|uniref:Uncharacterized protein n=2 Tax=Alphatristromavirus TaxID=2022739 RepID=A0A140F3I8_PFV1|nr:hypothetical protein A0E62_gp02 [Pyrobaculum filamentous virus 1]YP_010771953.1 hypothetical protein QIT34_gp02 [Pyrobaculum filamentous virus 2]AML61148.1 hypothetical protein [Pyrobaculum filamentous virus 1]QJF12375.1 hypothetical protein PFV2_gp02 [Pyrobaculum filamentous virus 2]
MALDEIVNKVLDKFASVDDKTRKELIAQLGVYGYVGLMENNGVIKVTMSFKECMKTEGARCLWMLSDGEMITGVFRRWEWEEIYDEVERSPVDVAFCANEDGIVIGQESLRVE